MPATYESIATTTLGSAQNSVSFTSISSSFTDLVIILWTGSASATQDLFLQFNADTATNYSSTWLRGDGTAAASSRGSSATSMRLTDKGSPTTTSAMMVRINVMNYANATTNKTVIARADNAASGLDATVGLWRKTPEAINRVDLFLGGSATFASGSTFTLYGIKAA